MGFADCLLSDIFGQTAAGEATRPLPLQIWTHLQHRPVGTSALGGMHSCVGLLKITPPREGCVPSLSPAESRIFRPSGSGAGTSRRLAAGLSCRGS